MAAKIKSILPPVISPERQSGCDDNQQLIRSHSARASTRRSCKPRFAVRSSKAPSRTRKNVTSRQGKQVFDAFEAQQQPNEIEQPAKKKKRRMPMRIVRSAGKRIEWVLKKGAKYFGWAIIKIFNQPELYTQDTKIYVA